MERPGSRKSDDVLNAQPEHSRPTRIHFPESPSPTRRRPYSGENSIHINQHLTPPLRRGSPLNPRAASAQDRRRRVSDDGPYHPSDSLYWSRKSPILAGTDDSFLPQVQVTQDLNNGTNEPDVLADEYDLYPRILQDVQRALKLKARREAKMKNNQKAGAETHALAGMSISSKETKSTTKHFSLLQTPIPSPDSSPLRKTSTSTTSDIDFSPSTTRPVHPVAQHPVPSSLDNGLTLDWGNAASEEEKLDKKWAISVRRKDKDKLPPLEMMQDQQERTHTERLARLRSSASSQTRRKAAMTSDQLQRRYQIINNYNSTESKFPVNLAVISRWYGSQDESLRQELEKIEPLTWLKHLPRTANRTSRWHLSGRIMEEFLHAQAVPQRMEPIPEHDSLPTSPFRPFTHDHLAPQHVHSLLDGKFSPRSSFDAESRRSGESVLSSVVSNTSNPGVSPVPSAKQPGYLGRITPHRDKAGSGMEEHSKPVVTLETSPTSKGTKQTVINLGKNLPTLVLPETENPDNNDTLSESKHSHIPRSLSNLDLPVMQRSLSSSPRREPSLPSEDQVTQNEQDVILEYERKKVLLNDAVAHNKRIRLLLNHISIAVKGYDSAQRNAMNVLGKKYQTLPKELVESFGHDPATVTGSTKRLRGWRVVEDIHQRISRQREVFANFISQESHRTNDSRSILDDQITSLMRCLFVLEEKRGDIAEKVQEVETVLRDVKKLHKEVKDDYDKTVTLTSVQYPEISQAIALEESYKDHYQQVWEFGMDALTFVLDTVTPFWRTYGKRIGEDVRDFLIIPLYRNEFTGEHKRYLIKEFPKRSLRHWLGLGLFFIASIMISILQSRAAITSSWNLRLQWIPYDGIRYTALPFFWVGIILQWCAVFLEFGIVFMEVGVIVWWLGWSVNLLT